jgi:DNA-binding CsgD family transcriptional regulator
VNELRRAGRLDDCIYSHFRLKEDGRAMGIAFHRPWGDTPFTERERAIVDLVHRSQCLYKRNFTPDENSDAISPRQREVLAVLQAGRSEKEAAIELGLSRHTVHTHVKSIYRRYAVCSRAELLSLWLKRG